MYAKLLWDISSTGIGRLQHPGRMPTGLIREARNYSCTVTKLMCSISGAFDTFYESHLLLMSPTRKSASALLSLLSPRQSCSRLRLFGHIVRSDSDEDHTRALNAGSRRSGDDLAVVLVKHGCVLSRKTSNNRIWGCGRPGTELITVNSGVKSWKQRHSCRGMLHDDDDDKLTAL